MSSQQTVFLLDLDGTLVDSVYEHVLAWHEALNTEGIELSVWRIHRKIGMSGGLLTNILLRETGLDIDPERVDRLQRAHALAFARYSGRVQPLPGAKVYSPIWRAPIFLSPSLRAAEWRRLALHWMSSPLTWTRSR